MKIFQCVEQLVCPKQDLRGQEHPLAARPAFGKELLQVLTRDILHDQKLSVANGKIIHDYRQSRVPQPVEQSSFLRKSLAELIVTVKGLFQCHSTAEFSICRLVDRSHTALSQQSHDQVTVLQQSIRS